MKAVLIIWGLALVYCIFEAIFFSELDPESKKNLKIEKIKLKNK